MQKTFRAIAADNQFEIFPLFIDFLYRNKIDLDSKECQDVVDFKGESYFCVDLPCSILRDLRIAVVPHPVMMQHLFHFMPSKFVFAILLLEIGVRGCDANCLLRGFDARMTSMLNLHPTESVEELQASMDKCHCIIISELKSQRKELTDEESVKLFYHVEDMEQYDQLDEYGQDSKQMKFLQDVKQLF